MSDFPPLKLPQAPLDIRPSEADSRRFDVYDPLRAKWVNLTPEEWVRQHFTAWLITCRGYMAGRMGNEIGIRLNSTLRRCDTVVYAADRRPVMIVEYKAPSVAITQRTFDQIVRYNMVLRVPYLVVSNGLTHYCCSIDYATGTYHFLPEIPLYSAISRD